MGRLKMMLAAASLAALAGVTTLPGAASADVYGYALFQGKTGNFTGGVFGRFDLTTGATYAPVTLTDPLVGLGELGGSPLELYGLSATGQLYTMSPTGTETATVDTITGVNFIDFGSTQSGLFALGTEGGFTYLYDLNTNGSIASQVKFDGGAIISRNDGMGLSTGSDTLYFTDMVSSTEEDLYTVNTSTGAISEAGTVQVNPTTPLEIGGLAEGGGDLWVVANNGGSGSHGTVDGVILPCSANVCTYGNTHNINPNSNNPPLGLAYAGTSATPPTPEPTEWALLLAGVGAVGGMLRLRRRRTEVQA
jgi:hypothetical protein